MNLMNLVEELAKNMHIENVKSEYENVISMNLGDFEVFFSYMEQRKNIMLHASLAMHDESKQALSYLLSMNNFYAQTQGLCLGIDGKIITAQQNIFVSGNAHSPLSTELFLEQCEMFFVAISNILPFLNDPTQFQKAVDDAANNTSSTTPSTEFAQDIRC